MGLLTPLAHANPDDNSLEYFLTHARALVHDVRENLVEETDSSASYLMAYEQELGMKVKAFQNLRQGVSQKAPENSVIPFKNDTVFKEARVATLIKLKSNTIWGIETQTMFVKKVFEFSSPITCPGPVFEDQCISDPFQLLFLKNVMRAHCHGFTENWVKENLPEGTPFDPQMAQSISEFLFQVREIAPFDEKDSVKSHPYLQFCQAMFPHLIPGYAHPTDDALKYMDFLIPIHRVDFRSTTFDIEMVWRDFFKWMEARLDRISTTQPNDNDDDEGAKPSLQAQYGKRLKRLLQIHPFKDNFKFCSPPKSDSSSKSEE